ncbi:hypothetical protein ACFL6I_20755, partial [candidate division KSB1 bacterium]
MIQLSDDYSFNYSAYLLSLCSAICFILSAKTKYLENIESLASFIHYRNIPGQLQKRIVDFYSYMWKKRLGYDES